MHPDGLISIPGFPKYHYRASDSQLISYQKDSRGKPLVRLRIPQAGGAEGYYLWENGHSEFWTLQRLNRLKLKSKLKGNTEMKKGDHIVGSIHKQSGAFSTTAHPMLHTSFHEAAKEAERLAKTCPEKKFVVLEIKGVVSVNDVIWS